MGAAADTSAGIEIARAGKTANRFERIILKISCALVDSKQNHCEKGDRNC